MLLLVAVVIAALFVAGPARQIADAAAAPCARSPAGLRRGSRRGSGRSRGGRARRDDLRAASDRTPAASPLLRRPRSRGGRGARRRASRARRQPRRRADRPALHGQRGGDRPRDRAAARRGRVGGRLAAGQAAGVRRPRTATSCCSTRPATAASPRSSGRWRPPSTSRSWCRHGQRPQQLHGGNASGCRPRRPTSAAARWRPSSGSATTRPRASRPRRRPGGRGRGGAAAVPGGRPYPARRRGPHVTIVGHSYGSVVPAARCATGGCRSTTRSPSARRAWGSTTPTTSATASTDLGRPGPRRPGPSLPCHGEDPHDVGFGATRFHTGDISGHSSYFQEGSLSLSNMGLIVAGRPDDVDVIE